MPYLCGMSSVSPSAKKIISQKLKPIRVRFSSQGSLFKMLKTLRGSGQKFSTEDTSGSFKIRVAGEPGLPDKIFEYNSPGDFRAMGVYAKLKKDIMSFPSGEKKKLETITPRDLKYWKINKDGFGREITRVINVDVSKAYPYAMFNLGLISRSVLKYLLHLDKTGKKISRLKGMGILAKRKLKNDYNKGRVVYYEIQENKYLRKCFFSACKVIDELMLSCAEKAGKDFLFFWVDGIYINGSTKRGRKTVKRMKRIIKKAGYKYSVDTLKSFKYNLSDKYVLGISFRKKNSKGIYARKPKTFSLPLNNGIQERLS
jgi:hypothetical protein